MTPAEELESRANFATECMPDEEECGVRNREDVEEAEHPEEI